MPALTGVRAIAAFLVFFYHNSRQGFLPWVRKALLEGHIGVNIFFVLSGFLIYYRYYNNLELDKKSFGIYMRNRVARIYPMFFLLTTCAFIYAHYRGFVSGQFYGDMKQHVWQLYLLNITLLKGFFQQLNFSGIGASWTLTVEECFYISAPLTFLIIRKNPRAFIYLPLMLVGIGYLLVAAFSFADPKVTHGFYRDSFFMWHSTYNGRCFEFFAGMYLARVVMKVRKNYAGSYYTYGGLLLIALLYTILCVIRPMDWTTSGKYNMAVDIFIDQILLAVAIAVFFFGLVKEQSAIRRFLSGKLLILLGKSSYVFYLIHVGFIEKFLFHYIENLTGRGLSWLNSRGYKWLPEHTNSTGIIFILLNFICLNIIAIMLFRWIEEPLNNLIRNRGKKRRKSTLLES